MLAFQVYFFLGTLKILFNITETTIYVILYYLPCLMLYHTHSPMSLNRYSHLQNILYFFNIVGSLGCFHFLTKQYSDEYLCV